MLPLCGPFEGGNSPHVAVALLRDGSIQLLGKLESDTAQDSGYLARGIRDYLWRVGRPFGDYVSTPPQELPRLTPPIQRRAMLTLSPL